MTPGDGDSHDFQRFVDAQDRGGTYERALRELRSGRKTSHWMWFVFPQIAGLGRSEQALLELEGDSAREVLGEIDALKLRSSMTLFAAASPEDPVFRRVLDRFFDGRPDEATVERL